MGKKLLSRLGWIVGAAFAGAWIFHLFGWPVWTFALAALSLIGLSVFLGEATEQLSIHIGQNFAGFINVTLSNLAELIIIFVAVRSNMIELVQGGIVGSIIGNLLFVMGCSIYFGCLKNKTLQFNINTGTLFINQFFLVAVTLLLPTLFDRYIVPDRKALFNNLLALMLIGAYVYYYVLSVKDERFKEIDEQAHKVVFRWGLSRSLAVLIISGIGAFFMSEFLIDEVELVSKSLGLSQIFIGFIILPFLGNISEHAVAIFAAYRGMTALSVSIAVGSASQVGMIVAPCAVFFGILTGNVVTLNFAGLPIEILIISLVGAYLVLRDGQWTISEGIMLLALYGSLIMAFAFSQ